MLADDRGPIPVLRFPRLAGLGGLIHAVTLRPANMASHVGPDAAGSVQRRRTLCQQLGLDFGRLTLPAQVHGAQVAELRPELVGAGRDERRNAVPAADGLVCALPGVPIMVLSADCALVVVYDPRRQVVGVAHASWKGTIAGVTRNLAGRMIDRMGCRPADLRAGIGPAAGPQLYQIGDEVREQARRFLPDADRYFPPIPGGIAFDMWACNRDQLLAVGVPAEQIDLAGLCTIADRRFFSYRRDGPHTGRFALLAALSGSGVALL